MAGIPLRDTLKIRHLIEQVQSGVFDANHVDALLIKLRPYAGRWHVFREIADFVAHADVRNRGVTCDSMTAFADAMRFFVDYTGKQRALDMTQPFPAYVYRLFISQADRADERKLREQFRVSHQSLVKKIKTNFKLDAKSKTYTLRPNKDGRDFLAALQFVTGFIHSRPAFDIAEFHAQLYEVLKEWKIEHDFACLKIHEDKVSAALLCLISGTEMVLPDGDRARCVLTAEHNYQIEIGQRRIPTGDVTNLTVSIKSWHYTRLFILQMRNDGCKRTV